jgi:hypothetical protein
MIVFQGFSLFFEDSDLSDCIPLDCIPLDRCGSYPIRFAVEYKTVVNENPTMNLPKTT